MTDTATDDTIIRMERLIAAPPALLFELCTDPAEVVKWWAPDGCRAFVDVLELKVGGRWRIVLHSPDGRNSAMGGAFRLIEPPRRLAYSWIWEAPHLAAGEETEVALTFEAAPGGTRLTLEHRNFTDEAVRHRHDAGWAASFDRISRIVSGGSPS